MDPLTDDPTQQAQDPEALVRQLWEQVTGAPTQPAEYAGGAGPISQHPTQAAEIATRLTRSGQAKFDAIKSYEQAKDARARKLTENPPSEEDIQAAASVPAGISMRNAPLNLAQGYGRSIGLGASESSERGLNEYRQDVVARATAQRIKEEQPDWSPTQIEAETRKRMEGGLATAQGGVKGFLTEKAFPMGVDYLAQLGPIGTAVGWAKRALGAGKAVSTAAKLGTSAASGALAFGAQGALRAPTLAEQDEAAAKGEDPYGLWARVKRGASGAVVGATAEGLGAALLPKELGENASLTEKLAHYAKGIPGRTAQAAGMTVAGNPKEAIENPAALFADALSFAMLPGFGLEDGKTAAKVREAQALDAPRAAAEAGGTEASGMGNAPPWAKDAVGKAVAGAEPGQENAAAAAAAELASKVADARSNVPTEPHLVPPSEAASALAKEMEAAAVQRRKAATGPDPQKWLLEQQHAEEQAGAGAKEAPQEDDGGRISKMSPEKRAALEAALAKKIAFDLKLDPAQDAQPQHERDVSRETVAHGALESQAADVASAAADNEVAAAIKPVEQPIAPNPTERWDAASVDALKDQLKAYDRGQAVFKGTEGNGDDPRRVALGRTLERQKAEIDRLLLSHEGRTLEQAGAIPHGSILWRTSPGLAALAASRPLPSKSGGITNDATLAGGYDRFAIEVTHELGHQAATKAAKRIASELHLSGNQEIVDKIAEHGEDAAFLAGQSFVRQTPDVRAHDEAWQKELRSYVKKQVDLAVNSFGSMYAKHVAQTEAAQRVTGAVDPNTIADKGAPGPDGNPEAFLAEKAVLKLAAAPGGPLEKDSPQTQSEVAQAWLRERALAKRKAAGLPLRGGDIPGRTTGDIAKARFVALWGEPKWLSLSTAERAAEGRLVGAELTPKVAAVHEYMRQKAQLLQAGMDVVGREGERGSLDTEPIVKGAEYAGKLWNTAGERRAFYSRADILGEKQWGITQSAIRAVLDTGERGMTTRVMENALDLAQGGQKALDREKERAFDKETKARQVGMSDESKFAVSDFLSGGRLGNKGEELPNDMRDAAFEDALGKLPEAERKMARAEVKRSRDDYAEIAREVQKRRPEIKLLAENYFPQTHDPLAVIAAAEGAKSVQESLANLSPSYADAVRSADEVARADVDTNYARLKSEGKPFAENLLHRKPGEKDPTLIDHDPMRARQRYMVKMRAYLNALDFSDYIDKELGGTWQDVRIKAGDTPREALARFTRDTARPNDAIRIEGRSYMMAEGDTGDDYAFPLKLISGGGRLDVKGSVLPDGSVRWNTRPSQWDPDTKEWKPRGEWKIRQLETRQGGVAQIPSFSPKSREAVERDLAVSLGRKPTKAEVTNEMVGGGRAHEARVQALRDVLSRAITSQAMSTTEKNVGRALKLTAVTTLAANPAIAAHIAVAGTTAGLVELGPKYHAIGMRDAPTREGRAWAKNVGINLDPVTSLRMLDPNAKFGERAKALLGTAISKSFWPMQQAHRLTRSVVAAGARARAYDEFDAFQKAPDKAPLWQRQAMAERIKGWALRGITDPAEQREAYARQRAIASAERTGTLISTVTTPKALATPAGRVLSQFMRPAIQTMNTGMKMLGREPSSGNFTHLARFIAAGALAAWLDRKLRTNVGWTLGPRVADLGNDWFGRSPGTSFPALNDPDSSAHFLGDLRLPLQTPLGAGPVFGTLADLSKSTIAWLQGDDDTLGKQWWLHHNMDRHLAERLLPGFKVATDMANAFAPGSALSNVRPSGDPDAPWSVYTEDGRLEYSTTSEVLKRKALLGSVGNNQTANALQFGSWQSAKEGIDKADKSAQKRRYVDLVKQFRATHDPAALKEATLLEQQFGFEPSDAERAEVMNNLPPWGRALQPVDANGKFDVIYKRYKQMDSLRTSPTEILRVTDAMLHDISDLTPDRRDQGIKMYRDLEARAHAAARR